MLDPRDFDERSTFRKLLECYPNGAPLALQVTKDVLSNNPFYLELISKAKPIPDGTDFEDNCHICELSTTWHCQKCGEAVCENHTYLVLIKPPTLQGMLVFPICSKCQKYFIEKATVSIDMAQMKKDE